MNVHTPAAKMVWNEAQPVPRGTFEQRASRYPRQHSIVAEGAGPFRLEHLGGAVNRIAAEHHVLAIFGRNLKAIWPGA